MEADETETLEREITNRRKRLNAGSPKSVKNEVVREVYRDSKVSYFSSYLQIHLIAISCLSYTMKFSTTPTLQTSFAVGRNRSNFVTSEIICFPYLSMIP
jgi:hypothetical protein